MHLNLVIEFYKHECRLYLTKLHLWLGTDVIYTWANFEEIIDEDNLSRESNTHGDDRSIFA